MPSRAEPVAGLGEAAPARRLGSNIRAMIIGAIAYAAGLWLQLVMIARFGGPPAVGAYSFALALTLPVMLLSGLQLRTLFASDARGAYSFREYRLLRMGTTTLALAAMVPVALGTDQWRTLSPVLAPICAKAAADALSDIYYGLWQHHERMGLIAAAYSLNSFASVGFITAAALLGGGTPGMALGSALGSCVSLLFVHLRTAREPELRGSLAPGQAPVQWRRLVRLAREAAPLGVIVLLGALQVNVPRYFIQHHAGDAALGLFAAAYQLPAAGTMVVQAICGAAAPRLARACTDGDLAGFGALTRKLALWAAALGVLGIAASALFGGPVLAFVFRPEFGSAAAVLVILSGAATIGFMATVLGYALTAARVIAVQPAILSASLAVASGGCAVLVPRYGATGAAWSIVAASLVQAAWSAVELNRRRESLPVHGPA